MARNMAERPTQQCEFEPYPEAGKYEKVERTCEVCEKKFTVNVPRDWYYDRERKEHDQIQAYNLPGSMTLEKANRLLEENLCGICQNRNSMDIIEQEALDKQMKELEAEKQGLIETIKAEGSGEKQKALEEKLAQKGGEMKKIAKQIKELPGKQAMLREKLAVWQKRQGQSKNKVSE